MTTAELNHDGRRLALMTTWAVMKTSELLVGGHLVKKRVPVTTPTGAPMVLLPGLVFSSESQAKDTLHCSLETIKGAIDVGALQWRTPEGARRLLDTPGYGNNNPQVNFGDLKKSEAGESYKNEELDNLTIDTGDNLTFSPNHLSKQDIEWKRTELNRQRPKMDVEGMDDSMLTQVLSQNHKG